MVSSWARGECITAQELLARHPGLSDESAIRLIYEEVCLRRDSGDDIATSEVVNRFPQWRDKLEVLLSCDRLLKPLGRKAVLPEAGERLGPFRLLVELGRGASGKSYLAAEPGLADRLVVLKIIPDDQEEHLSLARLQHTHIIPLFSEHAFPERGLRALCMPYLGGTTLARILEAISGIPPAQRRGRNLLEAIDSAGAARLSAATSDGPYRRYLEQATYIQAVCWIVACLAEGLESSHAHGLVHMDVKPSNVLMAGDGLPMMLDFHLARRPLRSGERLADRLGGTRGWMAPEHEAALAAVGAGHAVADQVDHRADIYALGLLLAESLAGPSTAGAGGRACRQLNCNVSVGLADIIDKCLAAKPIDRYPDAAALAEDLRRHLNDLPLQGVANRSLAETWKKWRCRRPAALSRGSAAVLALTTMLIVLEVARSAYEQRVHEIKAALEDGKRLRDLGRFSEAALTLSRGLNRAGGIPTVAPLRGTLSEQLRLARQGQKAAALHELAELIRFRYGIDPPEAAEAQTLMKNIQAIWAKRDIVLGQGAGTLDPDAARSMRADLLDLAIAWADARVRLAPPAETGTARQDALRLLDEAATSCGPSRRLDRLRRSLAAADQRDESAVDSALVTMSTVDHYDLGRSHLRARRFRDAALEFQRVLDRRPQNFWPNFYQGLCAYRLGEFHDAHAAFHTCIALAPNSAECYFNRARVAEALHKNDEAIRDYDRALELDSSLTAAWLNRGILSYKVGHYNDAIADLRRALRAASDATALGQVHYTLALAYLARGDRAMALASSQEALTLGHEAARSLHDRLRHDP
jgi:serine/threonine protein kinase/tetratricopeptide (TPR) repeat protein